MRKVAFVVALAAAVVAICGPWSAQTPTPGDAADLAIVGARVWTGNPARPWAEAVAVRGERIEAVGSREEVEALVGPDTRVIDADGGLVTPGFIDSHVHFLTGGERLASVKLRDAATPEEFIRRIAEFAKTVEPGTWIEGGDWDHTLWGGELPRRDWIDSVTTENPVFVSRLDGHMQLANSLTLELAGIDASTVDPPGGEIVRYPDGRPAGVLKDNASDTVWAVQPTPTPAQRDRALDAAMEYVAAQGVTTVHHVGFWSHLPAFRRARDDGRQITRVYACTPLSSWQRLRDTVAEHGRGDEWVRIGCLKGFVDGSLGSHTAAFLEPYTDTPDDSGFYVVEPDVLEARVAGAEAAGLQTAIHAIGDRAIRMLLDVYERTSGPGSDSRHRIEHLQHVHPDDFARLAELGIIASMQPYHAIDDGRWADQVIGPERALGTYAFRSVLDAGAILAFGSDWFVAPPTPLEGIYAAVTRRTIDDANPDGWVPSQKITVEEALTAYTRGGAYASFEEDIKGSIELGKLADLVVIDRDITSIDPVEIEDARVLATIVGGRVVFEADAAGESD